MIQLSKVFDNSWNGKCTALEVTVNYDPKADIATVNKVFTVVSKYGYNNGTRYEELPHIYEDITQILADHFPDTLDKMEEYDWAMVYSQHEDLRITEAA